MIRFLSLCLGLGIAQSLLAQTITVEVWNLTRPENPPQPSSEAAVRISTAANVPPGPAAPQKRPTPSGPMQNQYVLEGAPLGPLVDVTVRQTGYHPWVARDLYMSSGGEQRINVQLFKYDYPIKAPECFALKTQYELFFRKEQRFNPGASRKQVQHFARVKYADGLLALPNPSRRHYQSQETRRMLEQMNEDDRDELDNMIDGLFDLYDMNSFEQFAPSTWKTRYVTPGGGTVNNEVRLFGNHGTYVTSDGNKHVLENIDMFYAEDNNGNGANIIAGDWRFAPGTNSESSGTFRWKLEGDERHFEGVWSQKGDNTKRSWKGDRIDMRPDND
jgi:hypothetical protein